MDLDKALREFYRELEEPEIKAWNESPAQCFLEQLPRSYFKQEILPLLPKEAKVCNLGIGAGFWDDFLGRKIAGRGSLTSVDYDKKICRVFAYRQQVEKHPNASAVVCADILDLPFADEVFDCVTLIGTSREIDRIEKAWRESLRILKPGGHLLILDLNEQGLLPKLESFFDSHKRAIANQYEEYGIESFLYHYLKE